MVYNQLYLSIHFAACNICPKNVDIVILLQRYIIANREETVTEFVNSVASYTIHFKNENGYASMYNFNYDQNNLPVLIACQVEKLQVHFPRE